MTTSTLTPDAVSWVCTTVRDRSAIELDTSKTYLIEARLAPVAKQNGFASIDEFAFCINLFKKHFTNVGKPTISRRGEKN